MSLEGSKDMVVRRDQIRAMGQNFPTIGLLLNPFVGYVCSMRGGSVMLQSGTIFAQSSLSLPPHRFSQFVSCIIVAFNIDRLTSSTSRTHFISNDTIVVINVRAKE